MIRQFVLLLLVFLASANYNYIDLALKKCNNSSAWTVHGFWPEYNTTSWPQYCNVTKEKQFNKTKLGEWNRIEELKVRWNDCGSDPFGLWKHEWDKHGSCTPLGFIDFFNTTLNLYNFAFKTGVVDQCCRKQTYNGNYSWPSCKIPFNKGLTWEGVCKMKK